MFYQEIGWRYVFNYLFFALNLSLRLILSNWLVGLQLSLNLFNLYSLTFYLLLLTLFKFFYRLLSIIILIEFILITLLRITFSIILTGRLNFRMVILLTVFGIGETCIGLRIIVNFTRFWGRDFHSILNLSANRSLIT